MSIWSPTYQQSIFESYHNDKHSSEFLLRKWRQKSTGIDMEQNYVTVTLCVAHNNRESQCAAISRPWINVFQMLPKLSVAGDLSCSSRQTVPDARSCDSKTSVAESGTCAWNSECSVGRWAKMTSTMLRDDSSVYGMQQWERTRSSASAEGPRDAMWQSKCCQLPHSSVGTSCTRNREQIDVRGWQSTNG